jgi:hypothetical protein
MRRFLKVLTYLLGSLLGLVMLIIVAAGVSVFYSRYNCAEVVSPEVAKAKVESYLREPRASAVLNNKIPIVGEIYEFGETSDNARPDERSYKFRLVGAKEDEWGIVTLDGCGFYEMSGNFSGKGSRVR